MSTCIICHGVKIAPKTWGQWFCCLPANEYPLSKCKGCLQPYHNGCRLHHILTINDKHTRQGTYNSPQHNQELKCVNPDCAYVFDKNNASPSFKAHKNKNKNECISFCLTTSAITGAILFIIAVITLDHLATHYAITNANELCNKYYDDMEYCQDNNSPGGVLYFMLWFLGYAVGIVASGFMMAFIEEGIFKNDNPGRNDTRFMAYFILVVSAILFKVGMNIWYIMELHQISTAFPLSRLGDPKNTFDVWMLFVIMPMYGVVIVLTVFLIGIGCYHLGMWLWNLKWAELCCHCCNGTKYCLTQWCCDIRQNIRTHTIADNNPSLGVITV